MLTNEAIASAVGIFFRREQISSCASLFALLTMLRGNPKGKLQQTITNHPMSDELSESAATKLTKGNANKLREIAEKTGLRPADLLRIGLKRVFAEFEETGTIRLG